MNFIHSAHVTREKYRSVHKDVSGSVDSISSVTAGKTEMVCAKVKKTTAQKGQMAAITLAVAVGGTEDTVGAINSAPLLSGISPSDSSSSSSDDNAEEALVAVAVASLTSTGA